MNRAFVLVACLACAARAEPLWTREVPHYPGTQPISLGGELEVSGERYRVAFFVTQDAPGRVAEFFVTQFRGQGLPVRMAGTGSPDWVVAGFATREGLIHAVVLHAQEGRTLGFGVLKDARSFRSGETASALPSLEGTLLSEGGISGQGTAQRSSIVERPLQQARLALLQTLEAQGWTLVRERDGKSRILEHKKGRLLLQSVLLELEPGLTGLHQMHAVAEGDG